MIRISNESGLPSLSVRVDLCFFTISAEGWVPAEQTKEISRSMLHVNMSYRHFVFVCASCRVGYNFLAERTYALMQALAGSKCAAAVKIDVDGMFCANYVQHFMGSGNELLKFKTHTLPYVYGGMMGPLHNLPKSTKLKNAMKAASYYEQRKTTGAMFLSWDFARGPAYIVGREVAAFITSQRFESLLNTGLEDVNMGIHSSTFRKRIRLPMSGTDRYCINKQYRVVYHKCNGMDFSLLCNERSSIGRV